jgi:arginine:pyruvate transaminase
MRFAEITERLAGLGSEKWAAHLLALKMQAEGCDIIKMTIGEPDVPPPAALIKTATKAMENGRTRYSNGRGEPNLLAALSKRYTQSTGRVIRPDQFICLPGTQSALYAVMQGIVQAGDEVLVGDPMYATYEGVVAASGAAMVPVPIRAENGFRLAAEDIAARITPRSRAILLNSPHNPSGAILTADDIAAIGALAIKHDLWIVADEVYEELVFDAATFVSPLAFAELAERVIVVSSISKSHASPGFRSGWCVGSSAFTERLLCVAETMLFGNQPFIADMTAEAVSERSEVAVGMRRRFARRAGLVFDALNGVAGLHVSRPEAGMFTLLDVSALGMGSNEYALDLLKNADVAVMPGASFGDCIKGWVRIALTVDDETTLRACARIADHANALIRLKEAS